MPDFLAGPVTVRAPASSANLGPGFDSLGLCLDIADVVSAEVTSGGTEIVVSGEGGGDLPDDDSHLVVATIRETFAGWGLQQPGLRLACQNAIPQGRGLGSSAAAIAAGIRLAEALVPARSLDDSEALRLAAALEGHLDNVAACLLGGLTVAWTDDGVPCAVTLEVSGSVVPVVFVAGMALSTRLSRGLLPQTVTHDDASANSARAALLVAALTAHPELLLPATVDHLHQGARRPAMAGSMALVDRLRALGVAAVISGAGPSVLALCTEPQVNRVKGHVPLGWAARVVAVDRAGARVQAG